MRKKRIAIVTGASSGLGKEFTRRIVHFQSIDEVWCIARQPEKLQATARELGPKIRTFSVDLSKKKQIKAFRKILEQENVWIKILVNSAGFAKFCSYDDLDLNRSLNMIDVNVKGVVAMGLICIPYMGKGSHIINIASIASFQPLPYLNLYSATKAFVKNYSRALNIELQDRGIHVTAVCPGWIKTALFRRADIGAKKTIHHFHCMNNPAKVARKALRDAAAGKDMSVYGYSNKLCHLASKFLPDSVIMRGWLDYQHLTPKQSNTEQKNTKNTRKEENNTMDYGLIGGKLGHSYSKDIHEMLADYTYDLCPLTKEEFHPFMEKHAFRAINVTIPYKQDVIPYLYEMDANAKAIGAVNTIVNKDGKLYGHNTDFSGFLYMLQKHNISVQGKKCVVLGDGGASKAVVAVLKKCNAKEIIIVDVISTESAITYDELFEKHTDAQFIANTSPVGMYPNSDASPVDLSRFPQCEAVADVIYNPLETKLITQAKSLGMNGVNGLEMLVAQALYAIEFFLDTKLDESQIDEVYQKLYQEKASEQN